MHYKHFCLYWQPWATRESGSIKIDMLSRMFWTFFELVYTGLKFEETLEKHINTLICLFACLHDCLFMGWKQLEHEKMC